MLRSRGPVRALPLLALALCAGCSGSDSDRRALDPPPPVGDRLFTLLPPGVTGVDFENRLEETREFNVFTYRNFYNGGGVALGDLTGDGLPELVLTSNLEGSRLYLNEGEFRFRDITRRAGVAGRGFWATGVTLADVNGDGLLDLYVCYAGDVEGDRRANKLFIHEGVDESGLPSFREAAADYGLADQAYSTHAAFFDYDRDGDLDLYLVNNSPTPVSSFGPQNLRHVRDSLGGDKLYRNDDGFFVDVSEAAGIFGSDIGFGLGVAIADVNGDGWSDIYVSNDFFEQDYLYINRRDGTFAESIDAGMPYISLSSMGLDIADVDNDGRPDVYVTDMLPRDEYRIKVTASFESWDVHQTRLQNDYHHQFTRNMLHLNNGDGTFSEIGHMAGVARTDWSWSALIADFDQDGLKDIHVTNGMARDVTSQDYLAFLGNEATMRAARRGERVDFLALVEAMGSTPLPNYAFRNLDGLIFEDVSAAWGLDTEGFSNGAAYGDLDGDGALDLIVNNVNGEAFVYRNNARALLDSHYLQVQLMGEGANPFAVGAKVTLRDGERVLLQELSPSRGFQSSVDYVLTFGVGQLERVETLTVEWPDGRVTTLYDVQADQRLPIRQESAQSSGTEPAETPPLLLTDVTDALHLDFVHSENPFVDFERQLLLPKLLSTAGPFMAVADVNGDGLEDAFIGGAKEQAGALLIQRPDGGFDRRDQPEFAADEISEDLGAVFFDADGDGDLDLYVVSGGSEFSRMAPALQDRLYLNDGTGGLRKAVENLPAMDVSGSRVIAHDFDGDGDQDLFVGGRVIPWRYGIDPRSVLLANDGRGHFTDVTERYAPELAEVGMVTDAIWEDVDGDSRADLVVVGEWMPITIFRTLADGTLERAETPGLEASHGWWNRIVAGDFTQDGRTDFVVGNLGLNTRLQASESEPVTMYVKDFDRNGFIEQILTRYNGGVSYPIALRDDLVAALPFLARRFANFEDYALKTVTEVFRPEELEGAVIKRAHTFASAIAVNNGDGSFTLRPLPPQAQIAPVYGILADDLDGDGRLDLLLAGNFDGVEPEYGRMSASYGLFLRGDGKGSFAPVPARESGFFVPGEARDIQRIETPNGPLYVVARNDDRPLVFRGISERTNARSVSSARAEGSQ